MTTEGETRYQELTHELENAGRALAMATGIIPVAFPMASGGNVSGGGPGANYVDVGRLIWTLERFAEDIHKLVDSIERRHSEHPVPTGPGDSQKSNA